MKGTRIGVILILLTGLSQILLAAGKGRMLASIVGTDGAVAPLEIVSITGTFNDLLSGVNVHNLTEKTIVSYRLSWNARDTVPLERGVDAGKNSYATGMTDETKISILPHKSSLSPPQNLLVAPLNEQLDQARAPTKVLVLIGVAEVKFSDGSTWKAEPNKLSSIARPGPSAPTCSASNTKTKLMPASFTLRSGTPRMMMYQPRCGLCWLVDGVYQCNYQPYYICNWPRPRVCESMPSECQ